jgi:hypothetical protein
MNNIQTKYCVFVEVKLHAFLALALDEGEYDSGSARFPTSTQK